MNTKLLILILTSATIITLSLPSLAEMLAKKVSAQPSEKQVQTGQESFLHSSTPANCTLNIQRIVGQSFFCDQEIRQLTKTGYSPGGFYKTEAGSLLEIEIGKDAKALLHPETEIKVVKIDKTGTIDLIVFKGDLEVLTLNQGGRQIRVIAENVCINPEATHFRITLTPEISSGKIVVKNGMLRVTSEADPTRYFSLSTMFCLHFCDGMPEIPHKAKIKEFEWKLTH